MISDFDFWDVCVNSTEVMGAGRPSTSTSTAIAVGPGIAAAGAQANALGNSTNTNTGTIATVIGTQNTAAGRALAWADAQSQTGNNWSNSSSRAGGYANGTMQIGYTTSGGNQG